MEVWRVVVRHYGQLWLKTRMHGRELADVADTAGFVFRGLHAVVSLSPEYEYGYQLLLWSDKDPAHRPPDLIMVWGYPATSASALILSPRVGQTADNDMVRLPSCVH
jgi:hypothetical protein